MKAFNLAALLVVAFLASSSDQANAGKKKSVDADSADASTAKSEAQKTLRRPFWLGYGDSNTYEVEADT